MNLAKTMNLFLCLIFSGCAQFSSSRNIAQLSSKDFLRAKKVLSEILIDNKKVKRLPHDLLMYHWRPYVKSGIKARNKNKTKNQALVLDYVIDQSQRFYEHAVSHRTLMGVGLYAARDPFMSAGFGNLLLEFNFPKDTYYLDTRNNLSDLNINVSDDGPTIGNRFKIELSKENRELFSTIGCEISENSH